jgi:hypothetical protein
MWRASGLLSAEKGNEAIRTLIEERRPTSIGKLGATELDSLLHYRRNSDQAGECGQWGAIGERLYVNAGVYPADPGVFARFCRSYSASLSELDMIGAWYRRGEWEVAHRDAGIRVAAEQRALEPYYHSKPWSGALEGRRVLVVSPFAASIERQYVRRREIWGDRTVLPEFDLTTLRVPFGAALAEPQHPDWFSALDWLRETMAATQFDVALVGAGAWSLPLAVHAKALGRIGIHMGGATQVLFGIKGARWDEHPIISTFYNEAWVRPGPDERPQKLNAVEEGCYW